MQVQWYPGHMTKAKRAMQEDIRLVDLVIELVDARIPFSSRNPDIDELGRGKARLIVMNKADLADERANRAWEAYFKRQGHSVVLMDARSGSGKAAVMKTVQEACREKTERDRRRGIMNRPVRAMVVGIPNVGKSTFINTIAGRASAKTGNKPGVTRGNQWIRLNKQIELLDTPGILWPRFEDRTVGVKLAMIGSIRDEVVSTADLAVETLVFLQKDYPDALIKRYGEMPDEGDFTPAAALMRIAEVRGCRKPGNELDTERACAILTEDFRSGRLGRISLELPPDLTEEV